MPNKDNLYRVYKARCAHCGWEKKVEQALSAGLAIGDFLYAVEGSHNYHRCHRCKRARMRIVEVPTIESGQAKKGFWKVATE